MRMQSQQQESTSPIHQDDLITFIHDSWKKVSREFENSNSKNGPEHSKTGPCVRYYVHHGSNPQLKDFEPFDLESWWGKKVHQSHQNQRSQES